MEPSAKTVIYDSEKRGSSALEELRGIFQYRDLIYQLIRRDIVTRYKRSALGIAWTMLQPLGMMLVMGIVFSSLFQHVDGYIAYLLSGLIAWTFFAQTTSAAIYQIVWGSELIRRIYIPMSAFSISAIGTGLVNLVLSLIPLLLVILVVGRPVRWTIIFIPIPIIMMAAFAMGVSLILSTLTVYFPDIKEMYQILVQAWMYLTPIMYPADILPERYRFWLLHLNPMYYMIQTFRAPLYEGVLPSPDILIPGALIALVTLLVGWVYFTNRSDEFAYTI